MAGKCIRFHLHKIYILSTILTLFTKIPCYIILGNNTFEFERFNPDFKSVTAPNALQYVATSLFLYFWHLTRRHSVCCTSSIIFLLKSNQGWKHVAFRFQGGWIKCCLIGHVPVMKSILTICHLNVMWILYFCFKSLCRGSFSNIGHKHTDI